MKKNLFYNNDAFTLAEVLITLAVIGVVAAVTMPMLISNFNDRVNSERHVNIANKITQALEHMRAMGKLNQYASTEDFTDELVKYLKIAKRCDKNHLAECWPTEKVTANDGNEYVVANAKRGKDLHLATNTNNVGLILADGASVILNYNNNDEGLDVGDKITASTISLPVGGKRSRDFAYTTNATASVDFVMDTNGSKGPNSETIDNKFHDVRSFKFAQFSDGCPGEVVDGIGCIVPIGTSYTPVNCSYLTDENQEYCGYMESGYAQDYWAGAMSACVEAGMELPDIETLQSMMSVRDKYATLKSNTNIVFSSTLHANRPALYAYAIRLENSTVFASLRNANYSVICVDRD